MKKQTFCDDLHQILNGREQRQALRMQVSKSGNPSVSLNLNIPGSPKNTVLYLAFFEEVYLDLKNWLIANRYLIQEEYRLKNEAGMFLIFELKNSETKVDELKMTMEIYEKNHALGRFIDVDVCDKSGKQISSGKQKECFYCGQFSAIDCMKNKRHPMADVRDFQQAKIQEYFDQKRKVELSQKVSSLALRSILYEICLTPKPGLVDFNSNGIHHDMDFDLFVDSTTVIAPFFETTFSMGYSFPGDDLSCALPSIRQVGLQMESAMFAKTKGVNTQKGIIFLMGIALFAVGFTFKKRGKYIENEFVSSTKNICKNLVRNEFKGTDLANAKTHGEKCFVNFGIAGIRQEAEDGFPTVLGYSLPILKTENSLSKDSLIKTLLSIMAKLSDTNILYRSNLQVLKNLQQLSDTTLRNFSAQSYQKVLDFCIENKLSPGGAADLLSITLFLFLLEKENIV